jgi:hypothetical protein
MRGDRRSALLDALGNAAIGAYELLGNAVALH